MTFDLQTAERVVLKALSSCKAGHKICLDHLETQVGHIYGCESGVTIAPGGDWRNCLGQDGLSLVHQVVWDLIVQRVLTIQNASGNYSWSTVSLTQFGVEVLPEQRWSPYDPDGYLKELANKAPKLVKLCEMYIAEALTCFRGGAYLATAVMLGAASEGNVLDLLRRFHSAMVKAAMSEHTGYQDKIRKAHSFYEKYQVFLRYFGSVKGKLPGSLGDDWEGQMDGVLHLIRHYRNDAGHPTGSTVERMSAFRTLVLFPDYCQRIEQVGDWLESHANELTQ